MSHYTVGIVIPHEHLNDVLEYVEMQMEPYDENLPRNPISKWDFYEIGGRWGGWFYYLNNRDDSFPMNIATVEYVLTHRKFPFALITPDGEWHAQGNMGFFGVVLDDQAAEAWHAQQRLILTDYLDHSVVLVDAHI